MQNGKNRTLLLPMIYDFHQLMKAKKKQTKFPKLHNANSPQPEQFNIKLCSFHCRN